MVAGFLMVTFAFGAAASFAGGGTSFGFGAVVFGSNLAGGGQLGGIAFGNCQVQRGVAVLVWNIHIQWRVELVSFRNQQFGDGVVVV